MTITLEALRREREESAPAAYMTFAKHVKSNKLGFFCFFEGKDSTYYFSRVKSVFNGDYFPITCSGKGNVLKVYELINYHREYDNYKKAFFVDSDFDLPVSNPKIYETPCYAVENFYTSSSVFAEILKNEFGLHEIDEDFEKCIQMYQTLQKDYHTHTTLFNAWYACLKDIRNITNVPINASLSDSFPKEFVAIALTGVSGNYDLAAIQAKYPNAQHVDNLALENKIAKMALQDKGKIFRGKFELYFTLKILDDLIIDSKNTKLFISKPIKHHITHSQAISQFSQYAETPQCLIDYIKEMIK